MRFFFVTLALLAFPMAVQADTSIPLYYSRANIIIHHKNEPPQLPWQKNKSGLMFDVEVRDGMTMYNQKGWFTLSPPSEKSGIMMVFPAQGLAPIVHLTQYAPLDILMIDRQGTITQIVPGIKLSDLQDDITPASPILAFLFLRGGLCEKLSIKPGDIVEYKIFKRPPVILSVPAPQPAPAAQPAPAQ